MYIGVLIFMGCAAFVFQLVLCFAAKKRLAKLAPLCLMGLADAVCWALYFGGEYITENYAVPLTAFVYGVALLLTLIGIGAAWGVYGIVYFVQK